MWLDDLLAEQGDLGPLRARADAGDDDAVARLAGMLAQRGDLDQLRTRVDAGDDAAATRLVELLVERAELDTLRQEVDAGTPGALRALRVVEDRGDATTGLTEADVMRRSSSTPPVPRPLASN
jgi:hypothetical protein